MTFLREILVQMHVLPMSFKIFSDTILVFRRMYSICARAFQIACVNHEP